MRNHTIGESDTMSGKRFKSLSFGGRTTAFLSAIILLSGSAATLRAQDVRIVSRPLSPQNITDYGLTNTTQKSGGHHVLGLGQPAYLEVIYSPTNLVVTQFMWTVDSVPGGSGAALTASPLGAGVPLYSGVLEGSYLTRERKVLVPDVLGEYKMSVQLNGTTNGIPVSLATTQSIFGSKYRGALTCKQCHSTPPFPGTIDQHTSWEQTGHATFFKRMINGEEDYYPERCISCHTVGYDTTAGANNNGGFDDVATTDGWTFPAVLTNTNWDAMSANLQAKANIQCENCHGPGHEHVQIFGGAGLPEHKISISLSAGNCGQCHDAMDHHYKNEEWNQSKHSSAYFRDLSFCTPCHSTHDFIDSIDGDGRTTAGTGDEGISCAACHDPHADEGPHQLRPVAAVTLATGTVITNAGPSSLCMTCHKARSEAVSYIAGELGDPSDHFGPHHGPQSDIFLGTNGITYGMAMDSSNPHGKIDGTCVHCHMQDLEETAYSNILHKVGGHTFNLTYDNETPDNPADDVHVNLACVECHGNIASFDIGGHDYNNDGMVEGVQTEISKMLEQLAMLLPPVGTNTVDVHYLTDETNAAAVSQLSAAFNYLLVEEDGSLGVHNPKFAAGLLDASLRDMGVTNEPPAAPSITRILTRPLTPQEIEDLGLTNTTQVAGGTMNVGLGQPAYLEAQVLKNYPVPRGAPALPIAITQVDWSLDSQPGGSAAALVDGPLDLSVLSYSQRDQEYYNVVGRKLLVPDVVGQYDVSVQVAGTTNGAAYADAAEKDIFGATYLGPESCGTCHGATVTAWEHTGHATFFKRMINGETGYYKSYCISCHNVGFDPTPGAGNGGFDDVATTDGWTFPGSLSSNNWDNMSSNLQAKANIQCENCHGPASEHRTTMDPARMTVSLSSGNCGQCHDAMTHHYKNYEWNQSLHAHAYYSAGCVPCHTPEGFIDAVDGDGKATAAMGNEGVACATCHDPHSHDGPHQLRPIASVALMDGVTTITQGGQGKACMVCHRNRRDTATYVTAYHSRFGPHHGPQTDMLAGANAVDYGLPIASSRHMVTVSNACVGCHMQDVADTFPDKGLAYTNALHHVGGHTFALHWDSGTVSNMTDDVYLVGNCEKCHGDIADFDFGGADWDGDGTVEGVQSEIEGLLHDIAVQLPPVGSESVIVTAGYTSRELKAAFNYLFVEEDGSMGVHNPKYASGLLLASLDDLDGGIDSDKDGLPDDWEIANFGSLTMVSGSSDYDGDGLNDNLERVTGTDPKKKDSDNDGVDDLAELQAGSDPMNTQSTPDVAISRIYPAVEVAFIPSNGVTYQVQAVGELTTGIWINVDAPIVGSGAEIQRLFSIRRDVHQYYRVVELP